IRILSLGSLEAYLKENGFLPQTIIVFRDGVGEGQIGYVKEHEVKAIKDCFKSVYPKVLPKLVFVIVSKRINTRLFTCDAQGRMSNPIPGTVVDNEITQPERYDFFLVSQSVNQGTVSPTSFNVIEDESILKPDHIQRIAYKLTHLYYNWQVSKKIYIQETFKSSFKLLCFRLNLLICFELSDAFCIYQKCLGIKKYI
ncbi:UNVERIFIED_CONTAM: hypothetical protein GTU68_019042, partial [Idotea baltica]|nr:hypothetical protein [Idotea baltica]